MSMEHMLDAQEVADWLGVGIASVYRMAKDGRLPPPVRLGRVSRWRRSSLETAIAAAEQKEELADSPLSRSAGQGAASSWDQAQRQPGLEEQMRLAHTRLQDDTEMVLAEVAEACARLGGEVRRDPMYLHSMTRVDGAPGHMVTISCGLDTIERLGVRIFLRDMAVGIRENSFNNPAMAEQANDVVRALERVEDRQEGDRHLRRKTGCE